jgi:hypothetical protein
MPRKKRRSARLRALPPVKSLHGLSAQVRIIGMDSRQPWIAFHCDDGTSLYARITAVKPTAYGECGRPHYKIG